MTQYKKMLVPLDGSQISEAVLPHVEKIASALKASVSIVRIAWAHAFPGVDATEAQVAVVREAEEYVQTIEKRLKTKGLNVNSHVRYDADAAESILDHSEQYNTDFIVMATHGRTGPRRWALGSVAEKVVRHATTPVLLVRVTE